MDFSVLLQLFSYDLNFRVLTRLFIYIQKIIRVFVIFILFPIVGRSQYINTDSLVFVPGYSQPLTINQVDSINNQLTENNLSFFAHFLVPGCKGHIISKFGPRSGRMHYGTDIKMSKGDTVFAVYDGVVTRSSYYYGFGNLIILKHENSVETYYAHLSKLLVDNGAWVKKGEAIGLAGSTGRATTSHLHFEIHEKERAFDPELVFDFGKQIVRGSAAGTESLADLHRELKPKGYSNKIAVPEFYKVRPGDSLWVISRKFKTSIKEICRLNSIAENTILQVGQPLKLY